TLTGERERRRVELAELEVGQLRAGAVGEDRAGADRAARVRRTLPERGAAAGGENGRERADRSAIGEDPVAAPALRPERQGRGVLEHLDPLVSGDELGEPAGQCAPRLGPPGMDDSACGVAALE